MKSHENSLLRMRVSYNIFIVISPFSPFRFLFSVPHYTSSCKYKRFRRWALCYTFLQHYICLYLELNFLEANVCSRFYFKFSGAGVIIKCPVSTKYLLVSFSLFACSYISSHLLLHV